MPPTLPEASPMNKLMFAGPAEFAVRRMLPFASSEATAWAESIVVFMKASRSARVSLPVP